MANGELFGCFRQGSDIDLVLENSFALCAEGPGRVGVEAERPVKSWPGLEAAGVGKGKKREPFLAFPVVEATECGDWLLLRGSGTRGSHSGNPGGRKARFGVSGTARVHLLPP